MQWTGLDFGVFLACIQYCFSLFRKRTVKGQRSDRVYMFSLMCLYFLFICQYECVTEVFVRMFNVTGRAVMQRFVTCYLAVLQSWHRTVSVTYSQGGYYGQLKSHG